MLKQVAPDHGEWHEKRAPALWKDKGQVTFPGWEQLGACWAPGTTSCPHPAPAAQGWRQRGSRSLTMHPRAGLAPYHPKAPPDPWGDVSSSTRQLWPPAASRGGERWFEQMSISALATGGSHRLTEITDKRPLKPIVCQVDQAEDERASSPSIDGTADTQPVAQTSPEETQELGQGQP